MPAQLTRRLRNLQPVVVDGALAVTLLACAGFAAAQQNTLSPLHLLTIALVMLPLTLRRRYPILVTWTVGLALLLNLSLGFTNSFFETFAALVAVYTMFTVAPWRLPLAVTVAGLLVGLHVSFAIDWHNKGHVALADLPYNYLLFLLPVVLGYGVRTRRAYIGELEEHTQLLAREAALEERTSIARELHDVVAHSVSVMVLQATAAGRLARRDPAQAAGAFQVIQDTGRQTLTDLRRVVGVLRADGDDEAELEPQPGLDQLGTLVDQVRSAGMEVRLAVSGAPRPLPPGIELSAYRIVQEALTNVLKHANAAHAEVAVMYAERALSVEVRDDGDGATAATAGGAGLAGMRERVQLFGGQFHAGRCRGGYEVLASLPLAPTAL
ncbi:MAG TPA: histidine kinase [Candidatus Dormibacteraeota bacterium]